MLGLGLCNSVAGSSIPLAIHFNYSITRYMSKKSLKLTTKLALVPPQLAQPQRNTRSANDNPFGSRSAVTVLSTAPVPIALLHWRVRSHLAYEGRDGRDDAVALEQFII